MTHRFLPGLALVLVQVPLLPTASAAQGIEGIWCSQNETLYIEPQGIGFNEHTICDVANLPVQLDASGQWSSTLSCRNVYVTGRDASGNYETHEMAVDGLTQISLRSAPDGTLILNTNSRDEETHFLPCD